MSTDEKFEPLSFGADIGGYTMANRPWEGALRDLLLRVDEAQKGISVSLKLNVVFHIPGNMLKPEHVGARTGTYSKVRSLLMIQVAVPEVAPPDPVAYLKEAVHEAIEEAVRWAAKRKVAIDALGLHDIVERA